MAYADDYRTHDEGELLDADSGTPFGVGGGEDEESIEEPGKSPEEEEYE